jgi:hypothetical protein
VTCVWSIPTAPTGSPNALKLFDGFRGQINDVVRGGESIRGGKMGKKALLIVQGIVVLALSTGFRSAAQDSVKHLKAPNGSAVSDDTQPAPDQDFQLLRKDVRSQKKQIVAANMNLTDAEAEKFWPVYDRYAVDLAKIYDTKIALVQEYLDNYKTMTGDQAESYVRRRGAVEQQEVMQLRLKYVPEFRKVLSGRQVALFCQIDWRLELMINLQLAQLPLIEP